MTKKQLQKNNTDCRKEIMDSFSIEYFKVLFEPARIELILFLAEKGSMSINDISDHFPQDRSVISRHLDALYKQGILSKTKESRFTYYHLNALDIVRKMESAADQIRALLDKYGQC